MVGTGKGAEYGILIKGGEPLEKANEIDVMVFDKTGTLTKGKPEVTDILGLAESDEDAILEIAAALERQSEHPLAEAICRYAEEERVTLPEVSDFQAIPGHGVQGIIHGTLHFFGNRRLITNNLGLDLASADRKIRIR